MLDVHILTLPTSNKKWFAQCLASVEEARLRADYEVNVFVTDGVEGHIGKGRKKGYALGNSPWKTYVDDDDYILPEAFKVLGQHLHKDVTAIAPREHVEQNGMLHKFTKPRHHLVTFKSEFINAIDWDDWIHYGDVLAVNLAQKPPHSLLELDDVLYVHRVYLQSAGRRCRALYPNTREKLIEAIR